MVDVIDGDASLISQADGDEGIYISTHSEALPEYTGPVEVYKLTLPNNEKVFD